MRISYNWLKQFLQIDLASSKVADLLTNLGLEVESIEIEENIKGGLKGVVVAQVLSCEKHPNADRLKLTTVDLGAEKKVQIVCGAPNVQAGQKVAVATVGTVLYDDKGASFKIKKGKIRGQESLGMICAEDELGIGKNHEGIMVLDDDIATGTPLSDVFEVVTDAIFEIGLTPNRSDAMSHYGVARDLRAGLIQKGTNLELISPSVSNFHVDKRTLKIDIEIENRDLSPRYCGITITDITVKDSPKWIQDRLKSIGINPKNNIVDITNYVLHELGQPLHAFDASKIRGDKVVVKTLPQGTKITTLDEVERSLDSEDIIICDGQDNPLCIGGVLGGLNSAVTNQTKSIFLEAAYFDPVSIRKTAKRHSVNTDASFRFERGIDINFVEYSLKRAVLLIEKYAEATLSSDIMDFYPQKQENSQVFLSYKNAYRLIGQKIPNETIKSILSSLEIKINNETEAGIGLTIPSYRTDVKRESDIIEEVLRVYGYNNIKFSNKLNTSISFNKNNNLKIENTIADLLTTLGFYEIFSNSLIRGTYPDILDDDCTTTTVEVLNPLSGDLKIMRKSLLFGGLESIAYNINRKNDDIKYYEFGNIYHKENKDYLENKQLALFVTGNKTKVNWKNDSGLSDFFYIKGVVIALLERLGLNKLKTTPVQSAIFSEGITLCLGDDKLVEVGVVKPSILREFGIKQQVLFANFDWDKVLKLSSRRGVKVTDLSKFPLVKRDLALLLEEQISFEQIYNLAFESESKFLKQVDLFDVYKGEELPDGKKSYALSFTLQGNNKTLTNNQIDNIIKKIQNAFTKELKATFR